ncbi:hypothetical protein DOQ73_24085 [Salmonella enterica subsp. enterica]|nr:hypothetical protein [Salmonella enterica subsp. enterica serovar Javiana]
METVLTNLFEELGAAAKQAQESGDNCIFDDRAYENAYLFSLFPFSDVLSKIINLVESFPEVDYGGSGVLGGFIEEHHPSKYAQALMDSLSRQPNEYFIGLLNVLVMDNDFQDGRRLPGLEFLREFHDCLRKVISDSKASQSCKEYAEDCLNGLLERVVIN